MIERLADGDFPPALLKLMLMMLAVVPPALLLAYGRQFRLAWRLRPEFSLRKSEAAELDRALLLHRRVRSRLDQLDARSRKTGPVWRTMLSPPAQVDQDDADEREDLQAHGRHLCATIDALRRLPLQRLQTWVHTSSLRAALGRSLAVHVGIFALLVIALHASPALQAAPAERAVSGIAFIGFPFDRSLVSANAAAACLALVLLPGFYALRRAGMRREYALEFHVLRHLAVMAPDQEVDGAVPEIDAWESASGAGHQATECWFSVLGVPASANIDQVREAYKTLVKASHPDRLQDLSPAIRNFAEAETKKLNSAYEQALATLA